MTPSELKKLAKVKFIKGNPGSGKIRFVDVLKAEWIVCPTGLEEIRWLFRAEAEGFRPQKFCATWSYKHGLTIR